MTKPDQTNTSVTEDEILAALQTVFTEGANPVSIYNLLKSIFHPRKVSRQQILNAVNRLQIQSKSEAKLILDFKSHIESLRKKDGPQIA